MRKKKMDKKLKLNAETIRVLTPAEAEFVRGGAAAMPSRAAEACTTV